MTEEELGWELDQQIYRLTGDFMETSTLDAVLERLRAVPLDGGTLEDEVCGLRFVAFVVDGEIQVQWNLNEFRWPSRRQA